MINTMQDFVLIPPHDDIVLWEAYYSKNPHEEHYGPTPAFAFMLAYLANQEKTT